MADFENMSRPELVALCADRGLPTYGTKPVLAERLRALGEAAPSLSPHICVTSDGMRITCLCSTGEDHDESQMDSPPAAEPEAGAPDTAPTAPIAPAAVAKVREFIATYDIDELDDEEHAELCARVVAEAEEAGYRTRGGGRRLSGDHRRAKYAVSVR